MGYVPRSRAVTLVQGLTRVYSSGVNVNPVQVDRCYENVTERSHRHNQSQIRFQHLSRKRVMSQKVLTDNMSRLQNNAVSFRFRKTLKVRILRSFKRWLLFT